MGGSRDPACERRPARSRSSRSCLRGPLSLKLNDLRGDSHRLPDHRRSGAAQEQPPAAAAAATNAPRHPCCCSKVQSGRHAGEG
jgi:hypothetical protein